jgi:muramidase (phage lysozyme)
MYQITKDTWKEMGKKLGLNDFSSHTQDLMAVEILRTIQIIDAIEDGDVDLTLPKASFRWSSFPQGKGMSGRYPGQHSKSYEEIVTMFINNGGVMKK